MKTQTSTADNNASISVSYTETFVKITRFNLSILGLEDIIKKVSNRDPAKVLEKTTDAISFQFFDRQTKDGRTEKTNYSAEYILGGKVYTRKEVENNPNLSSMLADMKKGNWKKVLVASFLYREYEEGKYILL